jgi:hypothetical protein
MWGYENTGADLTMRTDSEGMGKKRANERSERSESRRMARSSTAIRDTWRWRETRGETVNEWMMIGKGSRKTRKRKNRSDLTRTLLKGGRKKSAVWRLLLYEEVRVLRLGINWSGGAKTGDELGATGLSVKGRAAAALACRYLARMYCCTLGVLGDTS